MTPGHVYDCAIVGAGFTGLAAAANLVERGQSVIVLEAEAEVGGLAAGFVVEGGGELERFYHHWFTSDTHVCDLAAQIGAMDQIIFRASRTGMYYAGKHLRLTTPLDLLRFKPLPLHDRIRTGLATLAVRGVKDWRALERFTAREWLIQLFGSNAYRIMWEPLLQGKFGPYADRISAVWFWNKLALRGGSRSADGSERLAYYRGGFARFARQIAEHVGRHGGAVRTNTPVTAVSRERGGLQLETVHGPVSARTALITTPLPIAADILSKCVPTDYVQRLLQIDYLCNVCLVLELDRSLSNLYWTNVNDRSFPFVGIIEHTNFEPAGSYGGRHIVYLSKYLPVDDALYAMNADEAFAFALPHMKRMFPAFDPNWVLGRHIWRARYAQPIVVPNYSRLLPPFETPIEGVFLATMAQVYPEDRGTNYAVREGKRAADRVLQAVLRLGEAGPVGSTAGLTGAPA